MELDNKKNVQQQTFDNLHSTNTTHGKQFGCRLSSCLQCKLSAT